MSRRSFASATNQDDLIT